MITGQPFFRSRAPLAAIVVAIALCAPASLDGQTVTSGVDPRVELMSIIFRLAGAREYSQCKVPAYAQAIDSYFAPYRNHEVVQLVRRLRKEDRIAYVGVMTMALHVKDVESLSERPSVKLDERWKGAKVRPFLEAARRFVADTRFSEFLKSQRPLYDAANAGLRPLLATWVNPAWLDSYFGAHAIARIVVVPLLTEGQVSYGLTVPGDDGVEDQYAILAVTEVDPNGQPRFTQTDMVDMVHEFIHAYISDPFGKFQRQLEKPGRQILKPIRRRMSAQGYGDGGLVIVESLVRASAARYLAANVGPEAARDRVAFETARNFIWLGELNQLMEQYERERDRYPRFIDFMPRIVEYFDQLAPRVPDMAKRAGMR